MISGIVNTREDIELHPDAIPEARMSIYRLTVSNAQLRHRIFLRGAGAGPPLPGDALTGQALEWLDQAAIESIAEADEMERLQLGDFILATDGLTVGEVALLARERWLSAADETRTSPTRCECDGKDPPPGG